MNRSLPAEPTYGRFDVGVLLERPWPLELESEVSWDRHFRTSIGHRHLKSRRRRNYFERRSAKRR